MRLIFDQLWYYCYIRKCVCPDEDDMTIYSRSKKVQKKEIEEMYHMLYEEYGYKCFNDVDIFDRININLKAMFYVYTALYEPDMKFFDHLISIEWDECIR